MSIKLTTIPKTVSGLVEPAVRSLASRLFILTGGRQGSAKYRPTIASFFETGIVVSLFEHLLMSPDLAGLEIRHEMPQKKWATTKPEQVDLWIRPPNGGIPTFIEAGDFTPGKVKSDARKMRRLNSTGTNWFLAFFRGVQSASDPFREIKRCQRRKGSLKYSWIDIDKRMTGTFDIRLPNQPAITFGWALIRILKKR